MSCTPTILLLRAQRALTHRLCVPPCSRYDISDEFSFEHMLEFSKLAVSFAIELGGWKKAD